MKKIYFCYNISQIEKTFIPVFVGAFQNPVTL